MISWSRVTCVLSLPSMPRIFLPVGCRCHRCPPLTSPNRALSDHSRDCRARQASVLSFAFHTMHVMHSLWQGLVVTCTLTIWWLTI